MNDQLLRVGIIGVLSGGLFLWLVVGFLVRVSGVWERVDLSGAERISERIELVQLGPFVRGRRALKGGAQIFNGWLFGRTLRLSRRDTGMVALERSGFPREIATKLDGDVLAKFTLKVRGEHLEGEFHPIKVSYTKQPMRITGKERMPSEVREYRRVAPTAAPVQKLA